MAHEELMDWKPANCERVEPRGPFLIRNNGGEAFEGSYSVVAYTECLITCGGPDRKARATELASALNEVWNRKLAENIRENNPS